MPRLTPSYRGTRRAGLRPRAQRELGGYETWLTINRVEKEASPKIVAKLMDLFAAVKD